MLLLTAGKDSVVPRGQQERFAEIARARGNKVAQIVFEGADHGEGGVYTPAGRHAIIRFLRAHKLVGPQRPSAAVRAAGEGCLHAAQRALAINVGHFPAARGLGGFAWWRHKKATLHLWPRKKKAPAPKTAKQP